MSCAECSAALVLFALHVVCVATTNILLACTPQMTVSGKRDYPGHIIAALLDVLPAGHQRYLIFCVDNQPGFSVNLSGVPLGQGKQQLRVLSLDLGSRSQAGGLLGSTGTVPTSHEPTQQQGRRGAPSAMSGGLRRLACIQLPCQLPSRPVRSTRTYPAAHMLVRIRHGMVVKV